jgi:hypothetical protein
MASLSSELSTDRENNREEHRDIFTKIGGHERGINTALHDLTRQVAKIDERSASTQSDMRLLRHDLQEFLTKAGSKS